MKLSVIIPTAGRPTAIRAATQSLLALTPERYGAEVLVVDNNTDEELAADLRNFCKELGASVRYVRERSPGLTAARHCGLRAAHGEILTFIDDDVEVGETWLSSIQDGFADPAVGVLGGPSIPRFTGPVPGWFWDFLGRTPHGGWMCPWLSLIDIGRDVRGISPMYIWGLNLSVRRSVIEGCGGFNPDLVPKNLQRWQGDGETGLAMRIEAAGHRCDYREACLVFHQCGPERLNVDYFRRRAYYQGVAESFTLIRSGRAPVPQLGPERQYGIRHIAGALVHGLVEALPFGQGWDKEFKAVRAATRASRLAGWRFHQTEVASDPSLLEWVRRTDFFDADIRQERHYARAV